MIGVGLTDEAKRVRIAEACGWKRATDPRIAHEIWQHPDGGFYGNMTLPDYLGSLDAMHEAEKMLTDEQWMAYTDRLYSWACNQLKRRSDVCADARTRATAFLAIL